MIFVMDYKINFILHLLLIVCAICLAESSRRFNRRSRGEASSREATSRRNRDFPGRLDRDRASRFFPSMLRNSRGRYEDFERDDYGENDSFEYEENRSFRGRSSRRRFEFDERFSPFEDRR